MHVHIYAFAGMAFCVSKHSRPHLSTPTCKSSLSLPHTYTYTYMEILAHTFTAIQSTQSTVSPSLELTK